MKRFILPALVAGFLCAPTFAQESVAKVVELKPAKQGGAAKMEYWRAAKGPYAAFLDMDGKISDKFQTDGDTVAALEFAMGGRVGINRNSIITITTERSATQGKNVKKIKLDKGGMWAKCDKLKEPLEIQTNGGVMGIKGTEFVVEANEAGDTKVSLLEGEIAVSTVDGQPLGTMKPGDQWILAAKTAPVKKTYEPEKLREDIRNSTEWQAAFGVISLVTSFTGGIPYVGSYGLSLASMDWERQPATAAMAAASTAASYVPGGGMVGSALGWGSSIASSQEGKNKKPDFPINVQPDGQKNAGAISGPITFSWDKMDNDDIKNYVVLVSPNEDFKALEWSYQTSGSSATYPSNAAPLAPGRHYWRVVPMDGENKPVDGLRGSQTYFELK